MAKRYKPMLLSEPKELSTGPDWVYEPKLDGYRIGAETGPERTVLWSRNGKNFTGRYPAVVRELPAALQGNGAVVDGEMVGFDHNGNPNFSVLRRKMPRVVYFIFDLLELNGEVLIDEPLQARQAQLDGLLVPQPHVRPVERFTDYDALLAAAHELGFEGIVAKRLDSPYRPDTRSNDWQKQILIRHTDGFARQ